MGRSSIGAGLNRGGFPSVLGAIGMEPKRGGTQSGRMWSSVGEGLIRGIKGAKLDGEGLNRGTV